MSSDFRLKNTKIHQDVIAMITLGVLWTENILVEADATAEVTCQGEQTFVQVTLCQRVLYVLSNATLYV